MTLSQDVHTALVKDGFYRQRITADWKAWDDNRRRIAARQLFIADLGIEVGKVDGLAGPQTLHAIAQFEHLCEHGKLPSAWRDDDAAPPAGTVVNQWPFYRDMQRFYGAPGKHQTYLQVPYGMRLAWDQTKPITRFSIHEKCHDSALRVLQRVLSHYGEDQIATLGLNLFGGCLNVRRMRGGTKWSTHAWGAAIDFDPSRNQLRWGRDKAELAKPAYEPFWRFWEEEGWVSLGRARNYDWMHVQAVRI